MEGNLTLGSLLFPSALSHFCDQFYTSDFTSTLLLRYYSPTMWYSNKLREVGVYGVRCCLKDMFLRNDGGQT